MQVGRPYFGIANGCGALLGGNSTEAEKPWGDGHFPFASSLQKRLYKVVKVLIAQSRPILCDPVDCCSLPGFSVCGILQARILE